MTKRRNSMRLTLLAVACLAWIAVPVQAQSGQTNAEGGQADEAIVDGGSEKPKIKLEERAWEYNPYRIKVWVCTDRSAELVARVDALAESVLTRLELLDPTCLRLDIESAAGKWRHVFLTELDYPEAYTDVYKEPTMEGFDKLMVVCLDRSTSGIRVRVRELDVSTQQWGPQVLDHLRNPNDLDRVVASSIVRAFMPISKVERTTDQDEVFTRARAMKACVIARQNEDFEFYSEPNTASPVYIKPDDRLLPVIRRLDRSGNLKKLEPIEYTFLTIDEKISETEAKCSIQSYRRVTPLTGRASKRNQKLALVVRPPEQSTTLTLVSRDDEKMPMEGIEIWSRGPKDKREDVKMIGKSDWEGKFVIPPNDDGMRIILLKRGGKGMMQLPIIPGFYPELKAEVPNDAARLFAEGVISGLNNEILNLVVQRELYEKEIEDAIKKKNGKLARDVLTKYRELPSTQDLKLRLSKEERQLRDMATRQKEDDYIVAMFKTLKTIINSEAAKSKETELTRQIQETPFETRKQR